VLASEETVALGPNEIQAFSYPYLEGGYQKESFRIESFEFTPQKFIARVSVAGPYVYKDERSFHLSAPMALAILGQIIIVHTRAVLNVHSKEKPVWMKSISMSCSKTIKENESIEFDLNLVDEIVKEKTREREYQFNISGGKFAGQITLAFLN
jgi:hypothetical protein